MLRLVPFPQTSRRMLHRRLPGWFHYQVGQAKLLLPLNIGSHCLSYDNMSTTVVQRSMEVGKPVIFVSMNYR